mgnify:CR=1 FL=1
MFKLAYITSFITIIILSIVFAPESKAQAVTTDSTQVKHTQRSATKRSTLKRCRTCGDKYCSPKIKAQRPIVRYKRKENRVKGESIYLTNSK